MRSSSLIRIAVALATLVRCCCHTEGLQTLGTARGIRHTPITLLAAQWGGSSPSPITCALRPVLCTVHVQCIAAAMVIEVCGRRLVGLDDLLDDHWRLLTSTKDRAKGDHKPCRYLCGHLITLPSQWGHVTGCAELILTNSNSGFNGPLSLTADSYSCFDTLSKPAKPI